MSATRPWLSLVGAVLVAAAVMVAGPSLAAAQLPAPGDGAGPATGVDPAPMVSTGSPIWSFVVVAAITAIVAVAITLWVVRRVRPPAFALLSEN